MHAGGLRRDDGCSPGGGATALRERLRLYAADELATITDRPTQRRWRMATVARTALVLRANGASVGSAASVAQEAQTMFARVVHRLRSSVDGVSRRPPPHGAAASSAAGSLALGVAADLARGKPALVALKRVARSACCDDDPRAGRGRAVADDP